MAHSIHNNLQENYITKKINKEITEILNKQPEDIPEIKISVIEDVTELPTVHLNFEASNMIIIGDLNTGINNDRRISDSGFWPKDMTYRISFTRLDKNPFPSEYNDSNNYTLISYKNILLYDSAFESYSSLAVTIAQAARQSNYYNYFGWQADFNKDFIKMKKNAYEKASKWFNQKEN